MPPRHREALVAPKLRRDDDLEVRQRPVIDVDRRGRSTVEDGAHEDTITLGPPNGNGGGAAPCAVDLSGLGTRSMLTPPTRASASGGRDGPTPRLPAVGEIDDSTDRRCDQEDARQHQQPPDVGECHAEHAESRRRVREERRKEYSAEQSGHGEPEPGEHGAGQELSKADVSIDHDPRRDPPQRAPEHDLGDELDHRDRAVADAR